MNDHASVEGVQTMGSTGDKFKGSVNEAAGKAKQADATIGNAADWLRPKLGL